MPVLLTSRCSPPNVSRAAAIDLVLVRLVGRVAGDAEGVLRAAELLDGLRERLGLAGRDDDLGALGDEPLGDAEADPAAGAGDDRDGALVASAAAVAAIRSRGPGR